MVYGAVTAGDSDIGITAVAKIPERAVELLEGRGFPEIGQVRAYFPEPLRRDDARTHLFRVPVYDDA